jgi:hypothetical protein
MPVAVPVAGAYAVTCAANRPQQVLTLSQRSDVTKLHKYSRVTQPVACRRGFLCGVVKYLQNVCLIEILGNPELYYN